MPLTCQFSIGDPGAAIKGTGFTGKAHNTMNFSVHQVQSIFPVSWDFADSQGSGLHPGICLRLSRFLAFYSILRYHFIEFSFSARHLSRSKKAQHSCPTVEPLSCNIPGRISGTSRASAAMCFDREAFSSRMNLRRCRNYPNLRIAQKKVSRAFSRYKTDRRINIDDSVILCQ